jgi:outer membrane scaffolding protein for murein synthesis (MipA/OmpV family)
VRAFSAPRIALTLLLALPFASPAEELPRWELGLGIAPLIIPDYPGSDETRTYLLPFPYFVYRGDIFSIDRDGLMGHLASSDRLRLTISGDAGVPVKSEDNDARTGMPDLDPTLELGPSLDICLDARCGHEQWQFSIPLRFVVATDFSHFNNAGWVLNPRVTFDKRFEAGAWRYDLGMAAGLLFANERQHDYYYQVDPAFATPARPAYDADGGFSGSRFGFALTGRKRDLWAALFLRYDNLSGAEFEDSPLVRTRHSLTAGFSVAWVLARSRTLVTRE